MNSAERSGKSRSAIEDRVDYRHTRTPWKRARFVDQLVPSARRLHRDLFFRERETARIF